MIFGRLDRVLSRLGFILWTAICAAAPEFIWQGTRLFIAHLSWTNLLAAALIGVLLAFFVEPILERVRQGRWNPAHTPRGGPLRVMAVALLFGFVAVCIHEALNAWFADKAPGAQKGDVGTAVSQVMEWACVPLITMLALFATRLGRGAAVAAGAAACAGTIAIGLAYGWTAPEIVVTCVPCCIFVLAGEFYLSRHWDAGTFNRLALLLAGIAGSWLLLVGAVQLALGAARTDSWLLAYDWDSFRADILFFAGWAIGISIAPNPVTAEAGRSHTDVS